MQNKEPKDPVDQEKISLGKEFMKALRESPRMYFAPFIGFWRGVKENFKEDASQHQEGASPANEKFSLKNEMKKAALETPKMFFRPIVFAAKAVWSEFNKK